jgi:flagellar protein FlgJ
VSINPPSDIVLDVARAADPARSVEATERLARMGPDTEPVAGGFSNVLRGLPREPATTAELQTQMELSRASPQTRGERTATEPLDPQTKAYHNFEALVLQNLVETMLPNSEEFFGEGTAGTIWKSMLAKELGTDLAKKVDLGIGPKHGYKPHALALHQPHASLPVASPVNVTSQNRS